MLRTIKSFLVLFAATLAAPLAFSQTVTLLAERNSFIHESATHTVANGVGEFGSADAKGAIQRFFIQFDIAGSIPAGSTIVSASLEFEVVQLPPSYQSTTFGVHRAMIPWGEGSTDGSGQGTPAQPGDAKRLHSFYPGTFRSNPGGDLAPTASGSIGMNSPSRHMTTSPGMAGDVQDFLDNPGSNFGWLIKASSKGNRTARGFAARGFSLVAKAPTLVVSYASSTSIITFCDNAYANSTGNPAVLTGAFGSGTGSDLHLDVSGGPVPLADGSRVLGYFLVGNYASAGQAISDGLFCLVGSGGSFGRYVVAGTTRNSMGLFDAAGNLENMVGTGGASGYGFDVPTDVHLAGYPPSTIMAGDTYHFQAWYRDTLSGPGHSNFTTGISATF